MITELLPITSLKFAEYNPRILKQKDFEDLQRSIDEYGFVEPVVVNKRNSVIVGGHQRVRAAKELGIEAVPVVWVDLDNKNERALNIALNKISGEFDNDMLAELLAGLDEELQSLAGFDDDEIAKLQDGWVDHEEPKEEVSAAKETRYTIDQLRNLKTSFKTTHEDHSVDSFINYLQHEAR